MNERDFIKIVREEVAKYTNEHLDKSGNKQITEDKWYNILYKENKI